MRNGITVFPLSKSNIQAALEIGQELPEWFSPKGLRYMRCDAQFQKGFVAFDGSKAVGFIFFYVNQGAAEISWMGVRPSLHGQGIGKTLIRAVVQLLAANGIEDLFVKTLGDSVVYEPYARTRAFYRSCGFDDFHRKLQPENPEMEEELTLRHRTSGA